jgi:hypothetical protein
MKKRTKLKTALFLLAAATNITYASESCVPPKKGQTPLEVLECLQKGLDTLAAENKKQQATIDTQQGQIAELKQENQRLKQLNSIVIKNAASHSDRPYMFSGLYCHWNRGRFDICSNNHSWHGNVNFSMKTDVSGHITKFYFQDAYYAEPFCSVSFENIVAHSRFDTSRYGINIALFSANGESLPWKNVSTWMYIICHGVD